jgi:hypothetical protein
MAMTTMSGKTNLNNHIYLCEAKMKQSGKTFLILRGGLIGVVSACIGIVLFDLIEQTSISVDLGIVPDFRSFGLIFLFGTIFSFLPTIFGGCLLANWLYNDAIKGTLTIRIAVFKGALLGAIVGFGMSLFFWFLINGQGSLNIFLLHLFEVTVIALLAGGLSGRVLAKFLELIK